MRPLIFQLKVGLFKKNNYNFFLIFKYTQNFIKHQKEILKKYYPCKTGEACDCDQIIKIWHAEVASSQKSLKLIVLWNLFM